MSKLRVTIDGIKASVTVTLELTEEQISGVVMLARAVGEASSGLQPSMSIAREPEDKDTLRMRIQQNAEFILRHALAPDSIRKSAQQILDTLSQGE